MSNKIKIDHEVLEKQILALRTLKNSDSFIKEINRLDAVFTGSKGETFSEVLKTSCTLKEIQEQFNLLFENTLAFLENTDTSFVEADEGLAEAIKNGESR